MKDGERWEREKEGEREGSRKADSTFTCHERVGVGLPSAVQVKVGGSP